MRDRMKDLLNHTVNTIIKEFKENGMVHDKNLRLCVEFCLRVGAIDPIFGELFQIFS